MNPPDDCYKIPRMDKPCCGNCRFWAHAEDKRGACRRYPPTPNPAATGVQHVSTLLSGPVPSAFVPPTDASWWCGEHAPSNQTEGP